MFYKEINKIIVQSLAFHKSTQFIKFFKGLIYQDLQKNLCLTYLS